MNVKNLSIAAAIGALLVAGSAQAGEMGQPKGDKVKCYGIAKAGKNDCGSKAAGHSCAGQSSKNADANDFIALPAGTCDKIANGSTSPGQGMMKK